MELIWLTKSHQCCAPSWPWSSDWNSEKYNEFFFFYFCFSLFPLFVSNPLSKSAVLNCRFLSCIQLQESFQWPSSIPPVTLSIPPVALKHSSTGPQTSFQWRSSIPLVALKHPSSCLKHPSTGPQASLQWPPSIPPVTLSISPLAFKHPSTGTQTSLQ